MNIDWSTISSIAGIVATIVVVLAFIWEIKSSQLALHTQSILALVDKLEMLKPVRIEAAQKLLKKETPNYALHDVLDFLSTIAGLYEARAIERQVAYREFSWWIIRYWLCARDYVDLDRRVDPNSWKTLERIANQLMKVERKEGYPPEAYSYSSLRLFLLQEARDAEYTQLVFGDPPIMPEPSLIDAPR